jgi:hypothetical protein
MLYCLRACVKEKKKNEKSRDSYLPCCAGDGPYNQVALDPTTIRGGRYESLTTKLLWIQRPFVVKVNGHRFSKVIGVGHGYGRYAPSCKIFHPFNLFDSFCSSQILGTLPCPAGRYSDIACIASLNDIMKCLHLTLKPISSLSM